LNASAYDTLAYFSVMGVKLCSALWSAREGPSISGKCDSVAFGTRPVDVGDVEFTCVGGREERNGGR
jgi:hypothetical protein